MNTTNDKPLYKVLNQRRTQGNWQIWTIGFLTNDGGQPLMSDNIDNDNATRIGVFDLLDPSVKKKDRSQYADPEREANAEYAALSVNNLHLLAEALQQQIDEWHSEDSNFHKEESASLKMARKALASIS